MKKGNAEYLRDLAARIDRRSHPWKIDDLDAERLRAIAEQQLSKKEIENVLSAIATAYGESYRETEMDTLDTLAEKFEGMLDE